jgi:hypothetical protein
MSISSVKNFRLSLILLTLGIGHASAGELRPFTTDGCSVFPEGTPEQQSLWAECCISHDLAYWKGGTYDERLAADRELESCVTQLGEPKIAKLMLAGVRVGGSPYLPTSYRWGYGWPYQRGYQALKESELDQVSRQIENLRIILNRFLAQPEKP